jgi:hypothetical protein
MCRCSDSLFGTFADNAPGHPLGYIARPLPPPANPLVWNPANLFTIVAKGQFLARTSITKVGATTGRTAGTIQMTCQDVNVLTPSNKWILCADIANYASAPGDSGSPVFNIMGATNNVSLTGIHFAGNGSIVAFSEIVLVEDPVELGPLFVCAPVGGKAVRC